MRSAVRQQVYYRIDDERERQQAKHGSKTPAAQMLTRERKLAIMVEEYLEAVERLPSTILGLTRAINDSEAESRVEEELLQVATVAVAWLEAIEVRKVLLKFRGEGEKNDRDSRSLQQPNRE